MSDHDDLREAIRHGEAALRYSRAEWDGQRYKGAVLMDANALRDLMRWTEQFLPKSKPLTVYTMRSFIGDSHMHYSNEWTSEPELFAHISLCLKNGHRVEIDAPFERMVPA